MSDASIPLQVRPPQLENPIAVQGQVNSLRQQMLNQQIGQQQLQAEQMANQERQRDIQDQDKMRQAFIDASHGATDTDDFQKKFVNTLMQAGVGPKYVQAAQQHAIQMRKAAADADEATNKATAARGDLLYGAGQAFLAKPQAQKEQEWPQFLAEQHRRGALSDTEYQQGVQLHPTYPGDNAMTLYLGAGRLGSLVNKEELERKNAESARMGAQARADAEARAKQEAAIKQPGEYRKEDASVLAAAAEQGADALEAARGKLTPERAKVFAGLTDPDDIRSAALSPAERSAEQHRQAQESLRDRQLDQQNKRIDALIAQGGRSLTPNAAGVQNRFNERELDAATKRHDDLQVKEQEQHGLRTRIGTALMAKDGEDFVDPVTGKDVAMSGERRNYLQNLYGQATKKVDTFAKQQKDIRQRYKMGEFGPDQTTTAPAAPQQPALPGLAKPAAPAAAAPPIPAPAPVAKPAVAKVANAAHIAAYAKAKRITTDAAMKEFKQFGYQIQ